MKAKKQEVKAWLSTRLTKPVADTMKLIQLSLSGHFNCYGVSGNFHMIQNFWKYVEYTCCRMLSRGHQKRGMKWDKFRRIWDYYVKKPQP